MSVFLVMACQKKGLPVISSRPAETPAEMRPVSDIKPDTLAGRTIFMNRCGRCHDLPKPDQYTAQRWQGILSYMIPRARLDQEQGIHVTAYLTAHAAIN
jgi:hypothetical protein